MATHPLSNRIYHFLIGLHADARRGFGTVHDGGIAVVDDK
jgi:hypothetical protein